MLLRYCGICHELQLKLLFSSFPAMQSERRAMRYYFCRHFCPFTFASSSLYCSQFMTSILVLRRVHFNCFEKSSLVSSSSQLSSHKCVVPPSLPGGTSLSSGAQSVETRSGRRSSKLGVNNRTIDREVFEFVILFQRRGGLLLILHC